MSEPTDYRGMSCEQFADMAAELALGVLTGRERAAALAHLDGCESCRELVRELTMTGEELLALLPSREPPPGFETRVLERIGQAAASAQATPAHSQPAHRHHADHRADRDTDRPATDRPAGGRPPGRPRSRMRRVLSAAAVVVALVVAGVGGWGIRSATAPSSPPATAASALSTAALLTSTHQTIGMVTVYKHMPWLYMTVNLEGVGNMTVECQLENAAGQYTTVGHFRLTGGYGSWASTYSSDGAVVGARLLSASNTVLGTATLRS